MDSFLAKRKSIIKNIVNDIISSKYQTINVIGAPGTGRTYIINECIASLNANKKDITIVQLYGDAGKQGVPFYPLDAYLAKKQRWRKGISKIFEPIPYIGPLLGHIIDSEDVRRLLVNEDITRRNENLSKHISFSKELLMLNSLQKKIVITCDDFQYLDIQTINYLQGLLPLFYENEKTITILASYRTITPTNNTFPALSKYKTKNVELSYPSKEEVLSILQVWGIDINATDRQLDAIYAATGGHLLLLHHVCQYLKKGVKDLSSIENHLDYFSDIINQRIRDTKSGKHIIHLLSCLAAIGREASIVELKCVLNQKAICPIINEAISLNLLIKDSSSVSFINDTLREINILNSSLDLKDFYLRYSKCLKTLMPSEYCRRALAESLAGNEQQSQVLTGLYLISQAREGIFQKTNVHFADKDVNKAVEIIIKTYRLAFDGKNEKAIGIINDSISEIIFPLLFIEAQYAVCVLHFKNNRKEERIDALNTLNSLLYNCDQNEFEIRGRLMRLCISLHCSLNNLQEARDLYNQSKKELISRMEYDHKSRYAYYELLLLSDSIFDPNTSHMTLMQVLYDLEKIVNGGGVDYMTLLYKTLVNLSSNCIEISHYLDAEKYAYKALVIADENTYMQFPNIGAAFNNYLLSKSFQKAYPVSMFVKEYGKIINLHLYEEDEILIKLNYAGMLLLDDQFDIAYSLIDSIKFDSNKEYDPYYICYYYIDKSISVYLKGDYTIALDLLNQIEQFIPLISPTRKVYYKRYYVILKKIMNEDEKYLSLQKVQDVFSALETNYLSQNWEYFKTVYLFSDLQIWSDF